jgi:transcriptional regulator with XRE-family HTH domain
MKTTNQIIEENLKKIRELSGFTQAKVALSIGVERSAYINYERATREVPYTILENIGNLFGCDSFVLYEDNAQINNEILSTRFNIPDIDEKDLKEIINFNDIVEFYLKMERIAQKEA